MSDNGEAKPGTYQITSRDLPFLEGATVTALGGLLAQAPPASRVTDPTGHNPTRQVMKKEVAADLAIDYAIETLIRLRKRMVPAGKGGPTGVVETIKPKEGEDK